MSNLTIKCPYCRTTLEATEELDGNVVNCPACGERFVVKLPNQGQEDTFTQPDFAYSQNVVSRNVSQSTFLPTVSVALSAVALILALCALGFLIFTPGFPQKKFSTDSQKAVRYALKFSKDFQSIFNYFWRKNGDKILKSLEIKEIKENGNWAVAFYTLSFEAIEVKNIMILYKNADGYWLSTTSNIATERAPKEWFQNLQKRIEKFTKDSGKFDDFLDIF